MISRNLRATWLRRRLHSVLCSTEAEATGDLRDFVRLLDAVKPQIFEILRKALGGPIPAKAVALKLLNLRLARYHFLSRGVEVLSRPPGLVVDPSNACNLACPGCVHSARAKELRLFDWKPGILPEDCLAAFFRYYGPSATHVTLCNYGEPLVNANTPQFIRMAKRYLMTTWLSTNMAVPRFEAEAYVTSGLDYMVLSVDGVTQTTYERFRHRGHLELVYENIRKLVAARERLGRRVPITAWRFLAFEHNVHEIPAAIERSRELGLDQFRADPAWDISWDDAEIRPAPIQPVRVDFRDDISDVMAANWNPFPEELDKDSIERDFGESWKERAETVNGHRTSASGLSCEWLYKSVTMDAGGRIFPCCCAPTSRKDLEFGRFSQERPGDSFKSEKHRTARLFFADAVGYKRRLEGRLEAAPYCVRCEWDKTADPSPAQIRHYFLAAAPGLFDGRSLDLVAHWRTTAPASD